MTTYHARMMNVKPRQVHENIDFHQVGFSDARHACAEIASEADAEVAQLKEWAKLAFRALNHVGPALLHQECETPAERNLVDRVIEMAEAAAQQYPTIAGVNYINAVHDARAALGEKS
jgi:hypothetical protein